MRVGKEEREVNCLAIDTAGPFIDGWELIGPGKPLKMRFVLVGAFRYRPILDMGNEIEDDSENHPVKLSPQCHQSPHHSNLPGLLDCLLWKL